MARLYKGSGLQSAFSKGGSLLQGPFEGPALASAPPLPQVYELDGLKAGPVFIGAVPDGSHWTETAREVRAL